jgi:hypothetical protein
MSFRVVLGPLLKRTALCGAEIWKQLVLPAHQLAHD